MQRKRKGKEVKVASGSPVDSPVGWKDTNLVTKGALVIAENTEVDRQVVSRFQKEGIGLVNVAHMDGSPLVHNKLAILAKDLLTKDVAGKPPCRARKKSPSSLGGRKYLLYLGNWLWFPFISFYVVRLLEYSGFE